MGQGVSGFSLNTKGGNLDLFQAKGTLFGNDSKNEITSELTHFQTNIDSLSAKYPYKNGKFGKKGKNSQVIETETPVQTSEDFFKELTEGIDTEPLGNGKGWKAKSEDGTIITYRPVTSTPNSPAIDINTKKSKNSPLKGQKIHFVTEEEKK